MHWQMQAKEKGFISAHSYIEIKAEEFESAGRVVPTIGGVCVYEAEGGREMFSFSISGSLCLADFLLLPPVVGW